MTNKYVFPILISVVVILILIPSEWVQIYKDFQFRNQNLKNIMPIAGVAKTDIEDTFGAPRQNNRQHEGVDIFSCWGTKIFSVQDARVLFAGRDISGGNAVKIFGIDNRMYYYAHLDSIASIKPGDELKKGQVIGFVGNTGNGFLTPPHLHFEIMEIKWLFPLITKNINPYEEF